MQGAVFVLGHDLVQFGLEADRVVILGHLTLQSYYASVST